MRLLIATGGTGGHIFPAVAVAEALLESAPESRVLFVGSLWGKEAEIIPQLGFEFRGIPTVKLVRAGWREWLKAPFVLPPMGLDAIFALLTFGPDVVLGAGGYASGAVVLAAALNRIPVVLLEQNAVPGRTNRLLTRFARRVLVAFPEAAGYFEATATEVIGNPIRRSLINAASQKSLDVDSPTLLVIGGSQGARPLNLAMTEALPLLRDRFPKLHIIHQTGELDYERVKRAYEEAGFENAEIAPFFEHPEEVYSQATVALSRAGAGVLFELALFGIPAIVVPFPQAADDHQTANAKAFAASGGGLLLDQANLNAENLLTMLASILSDKERLLEMSKRARRFAKPEAADRAVAVLAEVAQLPESPFLEQSKENSR